MDLQTVNRTIKMFQALGGGENRGQDLLRAAFSGWQLLAQDRRWRRTLKNLHAESEKQTSEKIGERRALDKEQVWTSGNFHGISITSLTDAPFSTSVIRLLWCPRISPRSQCVLVEFIIVL